MIHMFPVFNIRSAHRAWLAAFSLSWFLTFAWPAILTGETACRNSNSEVTEVGTRAPDGRYIRPTTQLVVESPSRGNTKYIRTRLTLNNQRESNWHLSIIDGRGRIVQGLSRDSFDGSNSIWTKKIYGDSAIFSLSPGSVDPELTVESVATVLEWPTEYLFSKQYEEPGWHDLFDKSIRTPFKRLGDNVGLITTGQGSKTWACTGIFLTPSLFLTNYHCGAAEDYVVAGTAGMVWSDPVCKNTVIDLGWDYLFKDHQMQNLGDREREFLCRGVPVKEPSLDIALLRVKPVDSKNTAAGVVLASSPGGEGKAIILIHHPLAQSKKISIAHCRILNSLYTSSTQMSPDVEFTHLCDTERSSSGGAIFNYEGELVGIHHRGFQSIAGASCDHLNKAIRIDRILKLIEDKPEYADIDEEIKSVVGRASPKDPQ